MTIRCPLCGFLLRSDKISSLHLVTEDKEVTRNQLKVMMMVTIMVTVMAMMTIKMVVIMRTLHLHLKLKLMIPVIKSYYVYDATFAQKYAVNIHMLQYPMFMHMPLYYHKKNEANFNQKNNSWSRCHL